jgi:hypothetical protein
MVIEVEDYTRQTIYLVDQDVPGTNLPCDVKSMTGDPRAGYHHPDELTTAAKWMAIALAKVMPGALPDFATQEAVDKRLDDWRDYKLALREYDEELEAYRKDND